MLEVGWTPVPVWTTWRNEILDSTGTRIPISRPYSAFPAPHFFGYGRINSRLPVEIDTVLSIPQREGSWFTYCISNCCYGVFLLKLAYKNVVTAVTITVVWRCKSVLLLCVLTTAGKVQIIFACYLIWQLFAYSPVRVIELVVTTSLRSLPPAFRLLRSSCQTKKVLGITSAFCKVCSEFNLVTTVGHKSDSLETDILLETWVLTLVTI
jgi:hypothetical protein